MSRELNHGNVPKLSISNVVGGGNLYRELDLNEINDDFSRREIKYNPESSSAAIIKYNSPKATVMLYSSGKFSLAGSKSIKNAVDVKDVFVRDIEDLIGETFDKVDFEIRYIVCTGDLGHSINLNRAITQLGLENIEYEPEQFPGLFFRPETEDWLAIIFSSGSIVINGYNMQDLDNAYNYLTRTLSSCSDSD